jgi:hypothetical protein
VTILLASHRLPAGVAREAREACKALDLIAIDWARGIPQVAPLVVIGGVAHGERRIPYDLVALLEAIPALRLVLCTEEPVIKQGVVVGDGRVHVLGPPVERAHLIGALRAALPTPAAALEGPPRQRFEVLRRSHWVAWARGRSGPVISLHEQHGATVVIGRASHDRAAIADAVAALAQATATPPDGDRGSALGLVAGDAGVAHLSQDASEWVVYWPFERCPLWICSPDRVPARWSAARGQAGRRLLRLPAFPEDQLIAAWSEGEACGDALARVGPRVGEGGCETIVGLEDVASRHDHVTGLVMEVR